MGEGEVADALGKFARPTVNAYAWFAVWFFPTRNKTRPQCQSHPNVRATPIAIPSPVGRERVRVRANRR